MRMAKGKQILIAAVFLILLLISAFGPLITLNPVKSGYVRYPYKTTIDNKYSNIYVDKKISEEFDTPEVFNSMVSLEKFHNLKYKKKIDIFICRNKKEMKRIFPFFSTNGSGFAWAGKIIVINFENADINNYDLEALIKHEAAHSLLFQNLKRIKDKIYMATGRNRWFREGLAVYNQNFYTMNKSELKEELVNKQIVFNEKEYSFSVKPGNYRVDYNLFGLFIEYLIDSYGKENLDKFIVLMVNEYKDDGSNFVEIYGKNLDAELDRFKSVYFNELRNISIISI